VYYTNAHKQLLNMNTTSKIIAGGLILLLLAAGFNYWNGKNAVTKKEFKEAMLEIEKEFDTVNVKLDTTILLGKQNKKNIIYLKNDNDTIKLGQELIYNQITEQSENTFLFQFKKLFE